MDNRFEVQVLNCTPDPERVMYLAMHQDYSSEYVQADDIIPGNYGEIVVKRLLSGGKGHYGCLEHPQITFGVGRFPHAVMQQARTHRVGISFDCQSFRYTGKQISELADELLDMEADGEKSPWGEMWALPGRWETALSRLFYIPECVYTGKIKTRTGIKELDRVKALELILWQYRNQAIAYKALTECGLPYEDARNIIGYGIRQHFVVSFNARSLMHFLDLRAKADAQLEIRQLCELILPHFQAWCPHVAQWYFDNRWAKAQLSP